MSVENQITTLSVVKIAIKFSPCSIPVIKSIPHFTLSSFSSYSVFHNLPVSLPKLPSITPLSFRSLFLPSRNLVPIFSFFPLKKYFSQTFFYIFFPSFIFAFLIFSPQSSIHFFWTLIFLVVFRCHLFHSYHVHQRPNSQFPSCLLFCFSYSNFYRYFLLFTNFHTISPRAAFSSKCSLPRIPLPVLSSAFLIFVSSFFYSECPVPTVSVSRRRRRVFLAFLSLGLGSALWRHLIGAT